MVLASKMTWWAPNHELPGRVGSLPLGCLAFRPADTGLSLWEDGEAASLVAEYKPQEPVTLTQNTLIGANLELGVVLGNGGNKVTAVRYQQRDGGGST